MLNQAKRNPLIKLYINHNILMVKLATCQNAESLKAVSFLKLQNMVNNNSIFNIKYAELSPKW